MSHCIRIIPRLDIKWPNLVKGVQLEGVRVLGRPEEFARRYSETGADELLYMDVVATLYGRNSLLDLVSRTSSEIFVPLTVGGGLRTLEDMRAALAAGADKVAINTAAVKRPELIREAAIRFGSSAVVVSIETKRRPDGQSEAYTDNGRERTGREVVAWAAQAAELGAGEILLTSVDREGTGRGFDVELVRRVAQAVTIPVIASGGGGRCEQVADVIEQGFADAVAVAAMVHYSLAAAPETVVEETKRRETPEAGNRLVRVPRGIVPTTLPQLKADLAGRGISCRLGLPGEHGAGDVEKLRAGPKPRGSVLRSSKVAQRFPSAAGNRGDGTVAEQESSGAAPRRVAIVDYRMGNLFSVRRACETVGLRAVVTSAPEDLDRADAVILPGVGAFYEAMRSLGELGLAQALREAAVASKPIMGICLGMQLLMSRSHEFGRHDGLNLIPGEVVRMTGGQAGRRRLKAPHMGWNSIYPSVAADSVGRGWRDTPLAGLSDGTAMYFVHSYHVQPLEPEVVLAVTRYGETTFCSSLCFGSIFACQFHPERSGPAGLSVYRQWAATLGHPAVAAENNHEYANSSVRP